MHWQELPVLARPLILARGQEVASRAYFSPSELLTKKVTQEPTPPIYKEIPSSDLYAVPIAALLPQAGPLSHFSSYKLPFSNSIDFTKPTLLYHFAARHLRQYGEETSSCAQDAERHQGLGGYRYGYPRKDLLRNHQRVQASRCSHTRK